MLSTGISGSLNRMINVCVLTLVLGGSASAQTVPSTSEAETQAQIKAAEDGRVLQRAQEKASSTERKQRLEAEAQKAKRAEILKALGAQPRAGEVKDIALTLSDIKVWLKDAEKRETALAALPKHGAQGLKVLSQWWKANRRDRIATERVAEAALAFGADAARLYQDLIGNGVALPVVARALTLLKPASTGTSLLNRAVERMKDDEARAIALGALAERDQSSAITFAVKLLEKGGLFSRAAAARVLGGSGDRTHIRQLVERLQTESRGALEENLEVRYSIHWGLSTLGGPDAVAPLIAALDRKDDLDSIVAALVRVGFPAVSPLILVIKSGDERRTPGAVSALLEMGEISAPYLADLLVAKKEDVRGIARDLLIAIHHKGTPADIESMLRTTPIDDPTPILDVLVQYDTGVSVPVFRYAFTHASPEIRKASVRLAGQVDMQSMVDELMKAVVLERDAGVQEEMVVQLHRMAVRAAASVFCDLAEDSAPGVRIAALNALADLGRPEHIAAIAQSAQESSVVGVKTAAREAVRRITGEDPEARNANQWKAWAGKKQGEINNLAKPRAEVRNRKARTLDGGEIPLRIAGEEGPYIIAIHGGPDSTSEYLLPFMDHLAEDWRVITFNLRGRDGTMASRKWLEDYSPESDIQDIEAVRRAVSARKVILVGHGFGAVVALKYASTYPQHVSRMVLMNMGVPDHEEWPVDLDHIEGRLPSPWKEAYAALRENGHLYTPTAYAQYLQDIGSPSQVHSLGSLPAIRERWSIQGDAEKTIYDAWGAFDLRAQLKGLPMRTLVLASDGDVFPEDTVPRVKKLVAGNKRIRFQVMTGASHFPFLELRKPTTSVVVDFLED